jgi:CheY-like chemotaxis protein/HPt (histidine-containing phosphotransfer) domain-containing protein
MPRTFPAWTPGLRILVVDDVSEARLALGNLLRGMGFGVDLAASGAEALVRLAAADSGSAPFHAVLLDRRMPGLDGIQTAVRMRALPLRKPPAYILVTASGGAVPERAGFDAVLAKPATPAALAGALRSALGGEAQTGRRPESKGLPSNAEEALLARCRGARVLLVEDDLTNREVALELLRGVGLETDIAADGQEAVAKAREAAYGLILMDVQMPVLDGLDATRAIRALPGCEDLPILGLTADAFHEDRARCLAAGMNDHIAKPVDPEALFQAMLRWLPERDAPAAAAPESGAAADLPVIPGVDVVRGLRNLNGRREAYLRLLRRFATSHRDDIARVRKACVEGATDAARRHCHSLKGAAGALGISEVEALAAELEGRLRDGADAGGIEACCAVCEASLRQIAAAILALPAAAGQGRPAIDWPQVRVCIERLDALLATDDMDAGAWFRETAPTLRDALGSRVDEIGRAIDGFAYDRALDALRAAAGARPELGSNDGPGAG